MTDPQPPEGDRVQAILDVLLRLASADLGARLPLAEGHAPLDLVSTAINFLADELQAAIESERELQGRLQAEVRERDAQVEALRQAHVQIERQNRAIRELSTPVIEVLTGVLVLPLVGLIDAERGEQIVEQLLSSIVSSAARVAILDVTGVLRIDAEVAGHIHRAVSAARLLGAATILTGVGPASAQAMVDLSVDFSEISTESSLKAGLRRAVALMSA